MPGFNGSGTFVRTHDWTDDKANGVKITASRMDAEDDGFATGLSTAICKDGQTTTTARIPFAAGISVGAGSVGTPALLVDPTDTNSGLYQTTGDEWRLSLGGTLKYTFGASTFTVVPNLSCSGSVTGATGLVATTGGVTVTAGGVQFPATQSSQGDANNLDDYEEGTFTPVYTYATAGNLSVAYSTQVGVYTKIGNFVHARGKVVTSTHTHTTASGQQRITGLPFAANNTGSLDTAGACWFGGINKASYSQVNVASVAGQSYLEVIASGMGQSVAAVSASDCASATQQERAFTVNYTV